MLNYADMLLGMRVCNQIRVSYSEPFLVTLLLVASLNALVASFIRAEEAMLRVVYVWFLHV